MLAVLLLMGNGILGVVAYRHSEKNLFLQIQGNVVNIAATAAAHVDGEIFQVIETGDEGTDAYNRIIEQLALFRDNAELEYIYTLRQLSDGKVIFVADSDPEEPAAIGDECEMTDALNAAFTQGKAFADNEPCKTAISLNLCLNLWIIIGVNDISGTKIMAPLSCFT